jgi:hypothetical protein
MGFKLLTPAGLYGEHQAEPKPAGIGLYVRDNKVYVVRPAKADPSRVYAVFIGNLNWPEKSLPVSEYIPGMQMELKEKERMTVEQAYRYGHVFGKCSWCGYGLSNEKSVLRGMGPRCYNLLRSWLS